MTTIDGPGVLVAEGLLGQLTLEEKISLLDGVDFWRTQPVERLGIPAIMLTDGPHGLRKQTGGTDHLGSHDSVPATCFPLAAGLASTWDVDMLQRVGEALGVEARTQQVGVLLGPGVNMKRTPLCGRNFEYVSEDPFLAGRLAAALVRGVQSQGVGTSLKHFAANNQETDRITVSAQVDERTLREIYLPAFEYVVRSVQPWTVMCSYNRLNGVYTSQDPWLLTTVLRDEWGFEGLVVSDWGAVDDRVLAVAAGLDLEMPSSGGAGTAAILEAVRSGVLSEADVDRAAARVLALVDRVRPELEAGGSFDADAHHALAREAAAASAVLLKNDGVLPLDPTGEGRVAVVGELARTPRYQGAGSSRVTPTRLDDALTALGAALAGREVTFAPGYSLDTEEPDATLVVEAVEAVEAARGAAVAVVFLGLPPSYESEGFDRDHMHLPAQQVALLEAVAAVNLNVVVVLSNGSAVTMPWQNQARAGLECWLLGQAGGGAVADLLVGSVNPSGRLAETIPLRYLDTPAIGAFPGEHDEVAYREGLLIGYRWYDSRGLEVAYPFGHGLSYTTFGYDDPQITVCDPEAAEVEVSLTVTNTGSRWGTETVQVYVTDPQSAVFRPEQELKGFTKVSLAPGESKRGQLLLDSRAFSWWNTQLHRWIVEEGTFEIRVGASSRDVRIKEIVKLPGDANAVVLTPASTARRWLEHPVAGPALRARLGDGLLAQLLLSEELGPMLAAIPIARLCRFPGSPVVEQDLPGLLLLQHPTSITPH